MDGEQDGAQAQGQQGEQQQGGAAAAQTGQSGPEGVQALDAAAFENALAAKDAQIAELEGKVAAAAKSAEAAESLSAEIAALKQQMADDRIEFELRAAGARSVTAAKALLGEHDGDVAALAEAEPWLFEEKGQPTGATGLEPADAAGGSDEQYMKRWAAIAGLDGKE